MPAAAVIPAPRAYTDIAAVKTLVVGCWAQVCRAAFAAEGRCPAHTAGGGGFPPPARVCGATGDPTNPPAAGTQPPAVRSCARPLSPWRCERLLLQAPFGGGRRGLIPNACVLGHRGRAAPSTAPRTTPALAHHRSPPPQPPWKTQCAPSVRPLAGCPSMEWQSIDRMWQLLCCAGPWCPSRGTGRGALPAGHSPAAVASPTTNNPHQPPPATLQALPRAPVAGGGGGGAGAGGRARLGRPGGLGPRAAGARRSASTGLLRVKDTAAPEVKFLDRCKINCSEGALHVRVRRSRMRVWGAKMIRHRRSPPP